MTKRTVCVACGRKIVPWFTKGVFTYFQCTSCKTVMTSPLPTNKQILAHYKQKFETGNYFLARQFSSSYLHVYQQFVDILEKKYRERGMELGGKRVLDVGCFTGDFLVLLSHKGADVYGSELQKEAVILANKKLPGRIMRSDIASKQFPKKKFDAVTLLGLIEHVTDPVTLLSSTRKILAKNGLLMIQTPNSGSGLASAFGKWWPPLTPIEHIHVFSAKGLRALLEAHGYTDIVIQPHIKWLPIAYVYHQFNNFGTHFMIVLKPFGWLLSRLPPYICLPFYGGEMIVTARNSSR